MAQLCESIVFFFCYLILERYSQDKIIHLFDLKPIRLEESSAPKWFEEKLTYLKILRTLELFFYHYYFQTSEYYQLLYRRQYYQNHKNLDFLLFELFEPTYHQLA